jgi:hypothetical protein
MQGIEDLSLPSKIILAAVSAYIVLLTPAALFFIPDTLIPTWFLYSILFSIMLIIVAPLSYFTYKIHWNDQKLLVAQINKNPLKSFEDTISSWWQYTRNQNTGRRFHNLKGAFFDKIFSAKNIIFTAGITSTILLAIPVIIFPYTKYLWFLGYVALLISIKTYRTTFKEWQEIEDARNKQIVRIYELVNPVMKFDVPPEYCVLVSAWENETTPQQIIISYPPAFRGDTASARESFQSVFNSSVTDEHSWIYKWLPTKNAVVIKPVESLPKMVEYRGSGMYEWHTFPIGVGLGPSGQEIITYNVTRSKNADSGGSFYPHVLIAGSTGSGKSVIQRNILFHCIQHNDMWRFLGIDLKKVELSKYAKYSETVLGIATDLEEGTEVMRYAHDIMMKRYDKMTKEGVDNFLDMVDEETGRPPYALMIMIDEAFIFLAPSGNKTAQGKYEDELHNDAAYLLGNIARLGRAAGIHLVLATQRPDATVIKGELKNNLDVRIAAGRLDNTPSLMVLDSSAATTLPAIKGRGIIRMSDKNQEFQGFFADSKWIDEWLAKPQNRWREPEFTSKMLGLESPKNKIARVEGAAPGLEAKKQTEPTPEEILEEFLQNMEEENNQLNAELPEQTKIVTLEDVDEHVPLDEEPAFFDDEMGILDEDEISDEEIEALLNELEKLEEDYPEEDNSKILEAVQELSVKDITETINQDKPFEVEFEEIFNQYMSDNKESPLNSDDPFIKPQKPLRKTKTEPPEEVLIPSSVPSDGLTAPLPYEPLVESRKTITDVIKEIPKPPSLEQLKNKPSLPSETSTEPKKPKLPPKPNH